MASPTAVVVTTMTDTSPSNTPERRDSSDSKGGLRRRARGMTVNTTAEPLTVSPKRELFSPVPSALPSATGTMVSPNTPMYEGPCCDYVSRQHSRRMNKRHATATSLHTAYSGDVIPPKKPHRTLVLCFDGTGDQFDDDNSNVVNFFSMLKKGDKDQQLCYYQAGIGTYTIPQIATPFWSKLTQTVDLMIASSLDHHVMGGYEFLMENYKQGDKICIFGFSRGAYTARALAGMVQKVGLLPNSNHQQVPFAYSMYKQDDKEGWKQSVLFKKTFSIDVDIEFVGVWDTVASVGLISRRLPFVKSNTSIKTFRHAISLDEHRAKFKPNTYNLMTAEEHEKNDFKMPAEVLHAEVAEEAAEVGRELRDEQTETTDEIKRGHSMESTLVGSESDEEGKKGHGKQNSVTHLLGDIVHSLTGTGSMHMRPEAIRKHTHDWDENDTEEEWRRRRLEELYTDRSRPTDVLEVWFAGCHCDVGGGSVKNDTRNSLARIPLRWMIRQCFLTNSGIQFQAEKLHEIGLDPRALWPKVKTRPAPLPVPHPPPEPNIGLRKKTKKKPNSAARQGDRGGAESAMGVFTDDEEFFSDWDDDGDDGIGGKRYKTEEEEELLDALCPMYDQLELVPGWWILELLPMNQRVQNADGTWRRTTEMNLGRARVHPGQKVTGIKVHRSVRTRMEAKHLNYTPRMKFEITPEWVD